MVLQWKQTCEMESTSKNEEGVRSALKRKMEVSNSVGNPSIGIDSFELSGRGGESIVAGSSCVPKIRESFAFRRSFMVRLMKD